MAGTVPVRTAVTYLADPSAGDGDHLMFAATKVCRGPCGEVLPRSAFRPRVKAEPDGYIEPVCRTCQNPDGKKAGQPWKGGRPAARVRYQERHGPRLNAERGVQRGTVREEVNAIKLASGCMDCGYNAHPAALDFDHVRGDKSHDISRMVTQGKTLASVKREIAKCEVVCANCHRIRTAVRRQEGMTEGGDAK